MNSLNIRSKIWRRSLINYCKAETVNGNTKSVNKLICLELIALHLPFEKQVDKKNQILTS